MNNLLRNLLFTSVVISMVTIIACNPDEPKVEPTNTKGIAFATGITPTDADDFEITLSVKNGDSVAVLSGEINRSLTIKPLINHEWLFSGPVFVTNCSELTIDAGTTIYYDADATQTSFLSIKQCSKIYANGTLGNRILMTSSNELGTGTGAASGDWGGLVINGYGNINIGVSAEGEGGTGTYGGTNDADNSGSIRYVVLKYPGRIVGVSNELNGFSFNAVGSATLIEYVQSFDGGDDGFEFFGGTAQVKYAVSTGSRDDSFDWTHGWRGKGQYWLAIQTTGRGDRTIEGDNFEDDFVLEPYSAPILTNLTLINSDGNVGATTGIRLRHGTKGSIHNAAITGSMAYGIRGDDDVTTGANVTDGSLIVTNSTVFGLDAAATAWGKAGATWESANDNISTPVTLVDGVGTIAGGVDANSVYGDSFFTSNTVIGAVSADNNWLAGWAVKTDGSDY